MWLDCCYASDSSIKARMGKKWARTVSYFWASNWNTRPIFSLVLGTLGSDSANLGCVRMFLVANNVTKKKSNQLFLTSHLWAISKIFWIILMDMHVCVFISWLIIFDIGTSLKINWKEDGYSQITTKETGPILSQPSTVMAFEFDVK